MSTRDLEIMEQARGILSAAPFAFTSVVLDYPGVLTVTIDNGDGTARAYVTGPANHSYGVEFYADADHLASGYQPTALGDTRLPVGEADGYRLAIQLAATIDRMEAEGEEVLAGNGCPECERSYGPHYTGVCRHV